MDSILLVDLSLENTVHLTYNRRLIFTIVYTGIQI
jgi:hypothetical protein